MLISRNLRLLFDRDLTFGKVPFQLILDEWIKAAFEPQECHRILCKFIENGWASDAVFHPEAIFKKGQHVARPELLYPNHSKWNFGLWLKGDSRPKMTMSPEDPVLVRETAGLLSWMTRSADRAELAKGLAKLQDSIPVEELLIEAGDRYAAWPEHRGAGIYRREHASVMIQSETTRILVDPIGLNRTLPGIHSAPLASAEEEVDAIFITHTHGDHWNLPTLLNLANGRQTPIHVPEVKTESLLSKSLIKSLDAVGLNGVVARWNTTVRIGDIEIDVLPFYGEQPAAHESGVPADVRNWGNCYRVTTPQFSVLLLVDSGKDPMGESVDVVADSTRRRGPPDVVMACLRSFSCPFFGGLSPYWATVPFSELRKLFGEHQQGRLPLVTAGPEGIAQACAVSRARYFLPYANGFEGVGTAIRDIGWGNGEPSESAVTAELAQHLVRRSTPTEAGSWNAGDIASFDKGKLHIQPWGEEVPDRSAREIRR